MFAAQSPVDNLSLRPQHLSGVRDEEAAARFLTPIPEPPAGMPAGILKIFAAFRDRVLVFRRHFEARDKAAEEVTRAAAAFDEDQDAKKFHALVTTRKRLAELDAALPADERALVDQARERIFNSPEAFASFAAAFDARFAEVDKQVDKARVAFADEVRAYLANTTETLLDHLPPYGRDEETTRLALRVLRARNHLSQLVDFRDDRRKHGNVARHIAAGQRADADQNFENFAAILAAPMPSAE